MWKSKSTLSPARKDVLSSTIEKRKLKIRKKAPARKRLPANFTTYLWRSMQKSLQDTSYNTDVILIANLPAQLPQAGLQHLKLSCKSMQFLWEGSAVRVPSASDPDPFIAVTLSECIHLPTFSVFVEELLVYVRPFESCYKLPPTHKLFSCHLLLFEIKH